jgi:hypothetical protein
VLLGEPSPLAIPSATGRRSVVLAVLLVTLARSAVLVLWEGAHFNGNQAVIGLMAKHLAEMRALPVFIYGQHYMLAVEAWLAAPVFLIAGATVTALKIPLLAMNLATAWLLVRTLQKEVGLAPAQAAVAAVFFVLPGPGTAARLLEPSGGTLEPLVYVLVLWLTRRRPVWCGLVLGIGFLNREFTIYGFVGLAGIAAVNRSLFTRQAVRQFATIVSVAAAVWVAVLIGSRHASAMGPGTTGADLPGRAAAPIEVAHRVCIDWRAVPQGYLQIVSVHWPLLFATERVPIRRFEIDSNVVQGAPGAGLVLGVAMLLATLRVMTWLVRERHWCRHNDFCAYLVLVGALSVSGYVIGRCGVISPVKMRYDMLSILGAIGLAAWYLRVERLTWLRSSWTALVLVWAIVAASAHGRLLAEYIAGAPAGGKRLITNALQARGIAYATAPYDTAYQVTFLSSERIIVASSSRVRVLAYQREFRAHRAEAVRIERRWCPAGVEPIPGVYFCPP